MLSWRRYARNPKTKPVDLPAILAELFEQFANGPMTAEAVNAATVALKKALIERAQGDEMNQHLGYGPGGASNPATVTNQHQRSGTGAKTVLIEDGPIRIEMPRDRGGSFELLLVPKLQRRFKDFDDEIVAMHGPPGDMTVREIQGFRLEQYATEVSPESIGSVIDEVMAKVTCLAGPAPQSHVSGCVLRRPAVKSPGAPWSATMPSIWHRGAA